MYVQLDSDYYGHPKTIHLMSILGPEADTYPPRLWTWAAKYAQKGVMKSQEMVEVACRWNGDKGRLVQALIEAGFLEPDGLTIHNWLKRTGKGLKTYDKKKRRMREIFRKSSGRIPEESKNVPAVCRNSSSIRGEEIRGDKIREEERKEEERKEETSAPPPKPFGPKEEAARQCKQAARKAKLRNKDDWVAQWIDAHFAAGNGPKLLELLQFGGVDGWTTIEIDRTHFDRKQPAKKETDYGPRKI